MLALEEILISTCWKSRVITFRFNGKNSVTAVSVILRPLLQCTGNTNRTTVNDWRLLCLTKITDQLNYSESHTGNLLYCGSIMEGYQYSNEHVSRQGF